MGLPLLPQTGPQGALRPPQRAPPGAEPALAGAGPGRAGAHLASGCPAQCGSVAVKKPAFFGEIYGNFMGIYRKSMGISWESTGNLWEFMGFHGDLTIGHVAGSDIEMGSDWTFYGI